MKQNKNGAIAARGARRRRKITDGMYKPCGEGTEWSTNGKGIEEEDNDGDTGSSSNLPPINIRVRVPITSDLENALKGYCLSTGKKMTDVLDLAALRYVRFRLSDVEDKP